MCDVPSIAVFCSESIECFHGTASKFFLKLLLLLLLLLLFLLLLLLLLVIFVVVVTAAAVVVVVVVVVIVVEGSRKLDRDHKHCKQKGEGDEENRGQW